MVGIALCRQGPAAQRLSRGGTDAVARFPPPRAKHYAQLVTAVFSCPERFDCRNPSSSPPGSSVIYSFDNRFGREFSSFPKSHSISPGRLTIDCNSPTSVIIDPTDNCVKFIQSAQNLRP